MSFKTDLHIHSWCSDGTMSPIELVEKYVDDKYDLIAITDHESIDGIQIAIDEGKDKNLRVIPGIELSTVHKGIEIHILGYYFDIDDQGLREEIKRLAEFRKTRNDKMIVALQDMGYDITMEDLIQRENQTYIGKPNFARTLIKKGYITKIEEAFDPGKFFESEELKSIEKEKLSTEDAIKILKEAGGMAVLAHPYKIRNLGERGSEQFKNNFDTLLEELKKIGLKGLECIYPKHTDEEKFFFINEAEKYHLHITEGSDFHGNI